MESFSSPFAYFVFLHWSFFVFAVATYILVWYLSSWKDFLKM